MSLISKKKGERIDKFLGENLDDLSRSYIQKLLKDGLILVNGKKVKANYKLNEGDQIDMEVPDPEPLDIAAENIPLDILYEDEDILIVNKPKGMVVHPSPGHPPMPLATDTIRVTRLLHLGQVASTLDIPIETLRTLNPQYKMDIIPATIKSYTLVLPQHYLCQYIASEEEIHRKVVPPPARARALFTLPGPQL